MKTVIVKGTKKEVEGLRAPSREAEGRRAAVLWLRIYSQCYEKQ